MKTKEKGKNTFTKKEEKEIKLLIFQLTNSLREEQKKIRKQLRKEHRFYISRFTPSTKGFTLIDFDYFKQEGKIIIYND